MLALCLTLAACGQKGPLYFAEEQADGNTNEQPRDQDRDDSERE